MTRTAKEAAKQLVDEGFPIQQYEDLQERRRERLALFQERGVTVLIEKEQELIAFGEEVLTLMRKAYDSDKK
jgi:hypothetical protein